MLGWATVVAASAYWILTSRWGRAFRAIRENEMRAEVVGVNLRNYKLMAFAIGAAYAGMGGALYAGFGFSRKNSVIARKESNSSRRS